MQKTLSLYDTTIGKKAIVAVTGLVLYGFVIVHMLGNLQVFLGPEKFNAYAATLKGTPPLLWGARVVLLVSVILHVATSLTLVTETASARPVGYRARRYRTTTPAALTMRYGGPAIALYLLFHLAHFTFPGVAMGAYAHSATDVYGNFVNGFKVPWVAAIYVAAQIFLGLHLYHGSWSLLQTLGLSHPRYEAVKRMLPQALGLGVAGGNILMPLAVLSGVIR
ncbi:MAG: succinate dehydrogenase cytochrome b subunit [Polyangiaceae bacterium]|jgi:succinate dehydrogenase / fumarate reductase cytochrome b subunit|nr:succinate dehydrogenase cytochrome b subunit [Polyangiaceae bacterium]MBK8939682.1 succinate dehydrogenase cytochrome b subunit [Polyangiaceae bacterium]